MQSPLHTKRTSLSNKDFAFRLLKFFVVSIVFITLSLLLGMVGYSHFAHLNLVDSFYNASMILTGMGPANVMPDNASKIFSSLYSIYSGVAFLTTVAIFIAPVVHRVLQKFHLDRIPNTTTKPEHKEFDIFSTNNESN